MTRKDKILLHLLPVALATAVAVAPAVAQTPSGAPGSPTTGAPTTGTIGSTTAGTMLRDSVIAHRPRLSQLIGTNVYNDRNESIGEVDDIILVALSATGIDGVRPPGVSSTAPGAVTTAPSGATTGSTTIPGTTMPGATTSGMMPDAMHGPTAIIQVGGFLGMGGRLVAVPLSELHWNAERERIILPNASKETLQGRPAFSYDTLRRG